MSKQYGGFMTGRQSLDDVLSAMYEVLPPEFSGQVGDFEIKIRFTPADDTGYLDQRDYVVWKVTRV